MIVKSNKDLVEKMNAKSWQYFENVLLPEIVTRRLDNSLKNDRKIYCFSRKPSFGNMTACDNSNTNLTGFIISVLTLLGQLKGNGKNARKGKIKNKYGLTTISS